MKTSVIIVLILLFCGNIYQFLINQELKNEVPYYESDKKVIDAAISVNADELRADRSAVMKGRFPVVIRLGKIRCVALKVKRNLVGEAHVYCFDRELRRMTVDGVPHKNA